MPALEAIHAGLNILLADRAHSFCKQIDDEARGSCVKQKSFDSERKLTEH